MRHTMRSSFATLLMAAIVTGCQHDGNLVGAHRCADIPPGAVPAEQGTYVCQWQKWQHARAEQNYFVIYDNEWRFGANEDGTRLGPFGERHLEDLTARLDYQPYSIVIDKTEDNELDQSRWMYVVNYLEQQGVADPQARVLIGRGDAEGLYGLEAPGIGSGFLGYGSGFGGGFGGGGFGGGGFGGGGFGGFGGGGFGGGGFGGGGFGGGGLY